VLIDPLSSNSNNAWNTGNSCQFTNGSYIVSAQIGISNACYTSGTFSNFAYEVQMTIDQGGCGGLVFRSSPSAGKLYLFRVCQDGTSDLYVNRSDSQLPLSSTTTSLVINQSNTIAVVTDGSNISLYVNNQLIAHISDSTYTSGQVGVIADATDADTQVSYNNARLWTF
jgi:hypothetical protein